MIMIADSAQKNGFVEKVKEARPIMDALLPHLRTSDGKRPQVVS